MADDITLPGTGLKVDTKEQPDGSHQQVMQVDGEMLTVLQNIEFALQQMVKSLGASMPDVAGRLRISLDSIAGSLTLATVTNIGTCGNVTTLSNQTNMGGFAANDLVPALMNQVARALRNQIAVS